MIVCWVIPVVVDLAGFALQSDMLPVAHPEAGAFPMVAPAHFMLRMSVHDAVKTVMRGQGNTADLTNILFSTMRHNFYSGILLKNAHNLSVALDHHL